MQLDEHQQVRARPDSAKAKDRPIQEGGFRIGIAMDRPREQSLGILPALFGNGHRGRESSGYVFHLDESAHWTICRGRPVG